MRIYVFNCSVQHCVGNSSQCKQKRKRFKWYLDWKERWNTFYPQTMWTSCCSSVAKLCPTHCYSMDCSSSCPMSQWCYLTISFLILLPSIFPSIRVFSSELAVFIRWPKFWSFSFSISSSNVYSELISFRID